MNIQTLARWSCFALAASLTGAMLSGCAADGGSGSDPEGPSDEQAQTEAIQQSSAALAVGTGGAASFSCSLLGCICHGDWDCNNMFEWGACGNWPAKCYERGPGPVYCICAPWVRLQAMTQATAGAATIGSAVAEP